eukprot:2357912-Amphidinium_carterae.3
MKQLNQSAVCSIEALMWAKIKLASRERLEVHVNMQCLRETSSTPSETLSRGDVASRWAMCICLVVQRQHHNRFEAKHLDFQGALPVCLCMLCAEVTREHSIQIFPAARADPTPSG